MFSKVLFVLFSSYFLFTSSVQAQSMKFKPDGINGSAGVGFVTWNVLEPSTSNVRFDQGTFAAIAGEKGFNFFNLYLNLSLAYMTGTGQTNYDYTTLSGAEHYVGSDVNFKADLFQAGLGLKWKIIDGYWFRPYVEAGGTGGYFTIKYSDLSAKSTVTSVGNNYKKDDSLLDFGRYAEGGVEITFSDAFGVRAGARFSESRTKKFKTLNDSEIKYKSDIYYFALLMAF